MKTKIVMTLVLILVLFSCDLMTNDDQTQATKIDLIPEVGFSSGVSTSATIPSNWTGDQALYFLGSPMLTGFQPNDAGVQDGSTFSLPFFDTSITFSVERAQDVITFSGTIQDESASIEVVYDTSAQTFTFVERSLVIDPIDPDTGTTLLGSSTEQYFAILKKTRSPIRLSNSFDYTGIIDSVVLFGPDATTIQIAPIEVYRSSSTGTAISGWATFSLYFGTPNPVADASLTGENFNPVNFSGIQGYLDDQHASKLAYTYQNSAQVTIYDGTGFVQYRQSEDNTQENLTDFPDVGDTAAVTLIELQTFLQRYDGWDSSLTDLTQ